VIKIIITISQAALDANEIADGEHLECIEFRGRDRLRPYSVIVEATKESLAHFCSLSIVVQVGYKFLFTKDVDFTGRRGERRRA
jgi:hypothetical protein